MMEHSFDGILAADELSAIYTMNTLQQLGFEVPKKVSVMGFTNGPMAQSSNPGLSVVSQHAERIGEISFAMMKDRLIRPNKKSENVVIQPELVLRDSTNKI